VSAAPTKPFDSPQHVAGPVSGAPAPRDGHQPRACMGRDAGSATWARGRDDRREHSPGIPEPLAEHVRLIRVACDRFWKCSRWCAARVPLRTIGPVTRSVLNRRLGQRGIALRVHRRRAESTPSSAKLRAPTAGQTTARSAPNRLQASSTPSVRVSGSGRCPMRRVVPPADRGYGFVPLQNGGPSP